MAVNNSIRNTAMPGHVYGPLLSCFLILMHALPILMGSLWQAFGIKVAFTTGATLALIASILLAALIRSDL